jgi:hypothetical protein
MKTWHFIYFVGAAFTYGFILGLADRDLPLTDELIATGLSLIWPFTLGILLGLAAKGSLP